MRIPGLAGRVIAHAGVFILLVGLFSALLAWWCLATAAPSVDKTAVMPVVPARAYEDGRIGSVLDVGHEGFARVHMFTVEGSAEQVESLALLFLRSNRVELVVNGERDLVSPGGSDYQAVRVVPFEEAWYDPVAGGVRIGVVADGLFLSYAVYLGSSEAVQGAVAEYEALSFGCFIVLGVMLLYAISLYVCKTDEYYLLVFVVYLATVVVTYLIRMLYRPDGALIPYAVAIATAAGVKYCLVAYATYLLVVGKPPRVRTNLLAFVLVVLLGTVRGVLSASSLSFVVSEATRVLMVSVTAAVIVWACVWKVRGTWILATGYAVFMASELTAAFSPAAPSAAFALWSYTAVFELPFTFACMLFINRRFAENYRRAEQLSAQLAALNRQLDQTVAQRTQEALEQRGSRHALMLNVFHDLRSPLFVLKGCTDILRADVCGDNPERRELLGVMAERIDFTTSLAEDLFTLAKLEDGDTETIAFDRVPLGEVVAATARAQAVTASEKGVKLEWSAAEDCWVWGNEERLRQMVQNLVANAVFYTPAGGSVNVRVHAQRPFVLVDVTDTGPGIKEEDRDKIFTRYYKARGNDRKGSTGLGLSIALGLAELHKGTIEVSSCVGKGSTFTVRLPGLS